MTVADGYITIDTRIDQKGFNAGVKKLGSSLTGILNIVKGIGTTLVAAFIGGSIIAINVIKNLIGEFDFFKSSLADKFKPLSDALSTLRGTVINLIATAIVPLIPYIVTAVQWLSSMLQYVTQIVAAFFGFKQTVGGIMEDVAKGADKSAKAVKGALAAFDKINVLQSNDTGGDTSEVQPFITPAAINILDDVLHKVENLKKLWDQFWKDPLSVIGAYFKLFFDLFREYVIDPIVDWWNDVFGGTLIDALLRNIIDTVKKMMSNTYDTFLAVKEKIIQVFKGIRDFITGVFTGDWALALDGLKNIALGVFGAIWEFIKGWVTGALLLFEGFKKSIILIWNALPQPIKDAFNNVLNWIKSTWGTIAEWFRSSVAEPIKNAFLNALNGIRDGFVSVFNNILNFVSNIVNGITDRVQGMINLISSIGSLLNGAAPTYYNAPISTYGFSTGTTGGGYKPPHLASGAVIPPNAKFAAILGDQRSGTNIEAPAAMFEEMLNRAVQNGGSSQTITVTFDGTLGALVRELQPHIKAENTRTGDKLK